jgi:hypothetical protein
MLDQRLHQRFGCPSTSASARNLDVTVEKRILGTSAPGREAFNARAAASLNVQTYGL